MSCTKKVGRWLLVALAMTAMAATSIHAQEKGQASTSEEQQQEEATPEPPVEAGDSKPAEDSEKKEDAKKEAQPEGLKISKSRELLEDTFDASNTNWGTYYDPQSIFCGKYDCYKILGFDYDSFGKSPPDTKIITKRYRKLSREWHPDKSKHRDAKERFVKIARAYEVLTDAEVRKEYDTMRFDQEAYFKKYGTSVLWSYAPKSDTTFVVIFIFLIANVFSWFSQKHRWQMVADRLIKAAVEDWSTSQGGSPESKELREQALGILNQENLAAEANDSSAKAAAGSNKKQKGTKKLSGREKKKMEEEALWPIVKALVNEMNDFGAGFHKPTWRDLLVVTLAKMPFKFTMAAMWNAKYYLRRLQKLELNDEEKAVLTERAVGRVVWDTKSDEEREDMMKRELWIAANRTEWEEEQALKNLSAADQKAYAKLKKKGKLE